MVLRKSKRAEETDTSRVIELILAPVAFNVSTIACILSWGVNLLFVRGQVFNFKASSVCPLLLAARLKLQAVV
jgi:hypothetical protein